MIVAIYSYMNTFITTENSILFNKRHKLRCNRTLIGDWEQFTIIKLEDNKIALKTFHGKYVSAQKDGYLNVNRKKIGEWEKFDLIKNNDNTFSFKSCHGKYISINHSFFILEFLTADKNNIDKQQKFKIVDYNKEKIKREENEIKLLEKNNIELEEEIKESQRKLKLIEDHIYLNSYNTDLLMKQMKENNNIRCSEITIINNNNKIKQKQKFIIDLKKQEINLEL